jgi:hypothetical protein
MKIETASGPTLTDLSPLERIKQADEIRQVAIDELIKEKQTLLAKVAEIDSALAAAGHDLIAGPTKRAGKAATRTKSIRQGSGRRTVKTADAIVTVLQGGKAMDIATISEKVTALKGKVSQASINGSLMKLRRSKAIRKVSRGHYKIG